MMGFNQNGHLSIQTLSSTAAYGTLSSSRTLLMNAWKHLTMIYSPTSSIRLFINGSLAAYNNNFYNDSANNKVNTITISTFLGSDASTDSQTKIILCQCRGKIDELKIFSRELNNYEVCKSI